MQPSRTILNLWLIRPQSNGNLNNLICRSLCTINGVNGNHSNQLSGTRWISRASSQTDDTVLNQQLAKYSKYQPSSLSMKHFLEFGQNGSAESSFLFLRDELPVRLANIIREIEYLPIELRETHGCQEITDYYLQSFREIMTFINANPKDAKVISDFTDSLINIRFRHAGIVTIMAKALLEVKERFSDSIDEDVRLPKFEKNIQYFLDRLYTSRISTRMLINQHTLLFGSEVMDNDEGSHVVGSIDPKCHINNLVESAYTDAKFLADQYYVSNFPDLVIKSFDMTKIPPTCTLKDELAKANIICSQIPSHVYHILFELFKNAIRATVEHFGEDAIEYPAVNVMIVKGHTDLTIKIIDRGGGIPKHMIHKVFEYLYTTAPNPTLLLKDEELTAAEAQFANQQSAPLAGYGYGLPLSRLYARYLSGDLQLYSMDGFGTDAVLQLHSMPERAKERLPIWHETGSKKIYESHLAADDWTDCSIKVNKAK